jgi:hypothetical protein
MFEAAQERCLHGHQRNIPDKKTYDVLHTAIYTLSVGSGQTPASADIPTSPPVDGTAGTAVKKRIEQKKLMCRPAQTRGTPRFLKFMKGPL